MPVLSTRPSLTFAFAAALVGCATPPPPASSPPPAIAAPASEVARYVPVDDATVYAYLTRDLVANTSGVVMLRVKRRGPEGAEIVGATRPQWLSFGPTGVKREPDGYFLLRAPLRVGEWWTGGPGSTFRVTQVDAAAKVEAGDFAPCVTVVEDHTGATTKGAITTVFCRDVGIVSVSTEGVGPGGAPIRERLELRSFGKAIDITTQH